MAAGFEYGIGDIFITMDADLQNDPEDIPFLLEKIKDVDVVSGWRKNRKDKFISRKLPSLIATGLSVRSRVWLSMTTAVRSRHTGRK